MSERVKAIIRIVALFVTAINAVLVTKGINPLPFNESTITEVACYIVAGLVALWNWWKNNNITDEAVTAQWYLNDLKKKH